MSKAGGGAGSALEKRDLDLVLAEAGGASCCNMTTNGMPRSSTVAGFERTWIPCTILLPWLLGVGLGFA